MEGLGLTYMAQSRFADALPLLREALEGYTQVLGEEHLATLWVLEGNARTLELSGEIEEAERLYREALDRGRRTLAESDELIRRVVRHLMNLLMAQGRYDEAEPLLLEALEVRRGMGGDDHAGTAAILYSLACIEAVRGDRGKALEWLRQSVETGFSDADWMARDPDLTSLHGDTDFEAILAEVKKRIGEE